VSKEKVKETRLTLLMINSNKSKNRVTRVTRVKFNDRLEVIEVV
jgi:hypothetical protein